ncbi:DUF6302 family protein [Streptomyces jumonjinensis]|uniref:DUF6302 family protein n=1 Tax=Streptomyces jumonjinensis TaxID=1945 RepID=UPI003794110E
MSTARVLPDGSCATADAGVTVETPQAASAYSAAASSLGDAALLTGAVTLRVTGAGEEGLLAVPSGPGRLGGFLPVPRPVAEAVAHVLVRLPGFADVRLEPDGRGGVLVVWGAVCPMRTSDAARRRFYGAGDASWLGDAVPSPVGRLKLRDAVMLDALAHGTPVDHLVVCRLASSEREVCERMGLAGEVLTGWRGLPWTALVHEAVCRGVVPVSRVLPVTLGPTGLAVLHAWASGAPRDRATDLAGYSPGELRALERAVCERLGARSDLHAVLRGHEAGLLGGDGPGGPVYGWSRGP